MKKYKAMNLKSRRDALKELVEDAKAMKFNNVLIATYEKQLENVEEEIKKRKETTKGNDFKI